MKFYYSFVVAAGAAALICGCQSSSQPTAAEQEILTQLKDINASLKEIAKNTPNISRAAAANDNFVTRKSDPEQLAKIKPLPEHPTDAEIRTYIESIQKASIDQNNFSTDDPQVELYRKIGPGHFKVWAPYLSYSHNAYHLYYASPALLDDADKAEALKQLTTYPGLIEAIIRKGWAKDAKTEIFAVAAGTSNPYQFMEALKSFTQTPEDRQKLTDLYLQRLEFTELYPIVVTFPGADAGALAQKAWENQRYNSNTWNKILIAARAASFGNKDALGDAINSYTAQPNDYIDQPAAILLAQTTGQILNKEALRKWYLENQDKLVFNAEKRRFEVK